MWFIERGEVANSWKTERWDSLASAHAQIGRAGCPAMVTDGDEPDGFRTMPETIDFIERYADVISAPVQTNTSG